jgi:hypothetical protein
MPKIIEISSFSYLDNPTENFVIVALRGDDIEVWSKDDPLFADRIASLWSTGRYDQSDEKMLDMIGFALRSVFVNKFNNVSDRQLAEMVDGWSKGKVDKDSPYAVREFAPRKREVVSFREFMSKKKR